MQAGGSQQHQPPRPGVQLLHPHPRQTRQVQVNGAGADPAPAGQHGLRPAKPCQQRRAEENGSPHLCRCLPRQGAFWTGLPESTTSLPCHWAVQPAPRSSARLHSTSESLARPAAGPAAGRAARPPEAAVRCFLLPERGPFRSKATHPLPRSVPRSVPYPQPPFRKRYHRLAKGARKSIRLIHKSLVRHLFTFI